MRMTNSVKTGVLAVMIAGSLLAQNEPVQNANQDGGNIAAQNQDGGAAAPNSGGWRRIGDGSPAQAGPDRGQPPGPAFGPPPAQLTIAPGTFVTIRLNQVLSSDHNQQGDAFSATLVKPVVVDGLVVADRGQTILGTVSEAKKAGLVHGTSRLGLELTDMTLVDGHQVPVHTSFVSRNGSTSVGRDAVGVGTTTAVGAGVGAAAAGGSGAAIGAGAGAAAGVLGVLLTRGNPTFVYPEQVLTFRVENPILISTERAPQAFRPVGPQDYQQTGDAPRLQRRPPVRAYYGPGYAGAWPYYYPYYPYYYGPSIGIGFGYGGRFRR